MGDDGADGGLGTVGASEGVALSGEADYLLVDDAEGDAGVVADTELGLVGRSVLALAD